MTGYLRTLQRTIDFIEEHLDEPLDVRGIARHAGMSMWHFQRVFSAALGQPVMDYVRRRRLSRAAGALCSTRRNLIDIALDSGFQSQEAFTRAFKATFGITPGACRKTLGEGLALQAAPVLTADFLFHLHHGITMTPSIETFPSRLVVGIERPFISALSLKRNNYIVIPQLWQDFSEHLAAIPHRANDLLLGAITCEEGQDERCRYLACVEVSSADEVPRGMISRELTGGKFAVFTHKGPMDRFDRTVAYVYGSWLPRSGQQLRNAPEIEIYGGKFDPGSPDSEMEYAVPIV